MMYTTEFFSVRISSRHSNIDDVYLNKKQIYKYLKTVRDNDKREGLGRVGILFKFDTIVEITYNAGA